jgi:hypothetical protein
MEQEMQPEAEKEHVETELDMGSQKETEMRGGEEGAEAIARCRPNRAVIARTSVDFQSA